MAVRRIIGRRLHEAQYCRIIIALGMTDLSPYPHFQRIWNDGSGKVIGLRWTLETSAAAITSAVIAIVLSITIARLACLINSLLYLFILHKRTKSALDDQAEVLAVNARSPPNLLVSLVSLLYTSRLKALSSLVFFVLFLSTTLQLPLYVVSVLVIERLFSGAPVPLTLGLCGQPMTETSTSVGWSNYDSISKPHVSRIFQDMDVVFSGCTDDGSRMTCSGPINKPFSWDIFESNTSECWFGDEHCGNNSQTILQRATITTENLGTTRKSRLAVTYISECSHIDDTGLYSIEVDNVTFPTNIKAINESYYGYDLGNTTTNPVNNFTILIWGSDAFAQSYTLRFWTYPMQGMNFSDTGEWTPVSFLTAPLNGSNQLDNKQGSQTLTLVFNRLVGILSLHPYTDPFFLTKQLPFNGNSTPPLYLCGQPAGLLAFRDQMRLHVRPTTDHPQEYTSDDVVAIGRYEEVAEQFAAYLSILQRWNPEAARALGTDWNLFAASAFPTIRLGLDGLTGLGLRASKSVDVGGFQVGDVHNITTRAEATRWFGVSMLYRLYSAQIFTSGVENDWGFGVSPIPSLEGTQHWVCSKTLRIASTYASLNFSGLIGLIVFAVVLIALSFTVEPFLFWVVSRQSKDLKASHPTLKRALLSKSLHDALHLHRIAVEKTYAYRFSRAANHEAPIYGVKAEETFFGDQDARIGRDLYQSGLRNEPNSSRSSKVLWATMLQAEDEYVGDYNLRRLR